jgi:microcystin-dependent protein
MATPFLGEIKMVSFAFPPKGWAFCNGQFLPINQNQALFSLMGTMYGGNGQTTFALPDLRGRSPMHVGSGYVQGQAGGQEFHTLTQGEMPAHTHFLQATSLTGNSTAPAGNRFAAARGQYAESGDVAMHPASLTNVGGSQPHENRMPFTVISFIVALQGVFPIQP